MSQTAPTTDAARDAGQDCTLCEGTGHHPGLVSKQLCSRCHGTGKISATLPITIKRKVWMLVSDVHNCGTEVEVFGTEEELNADLVLLMEKRAKDLGVKRGHKESGEGEPRDGAVAMLALIDAGDIDAAWEVFNNGPDGDTLGEVKHFDDAFWTDSKEVEFALEVTK